MRNGEPEHSSQTTVVFENTYPDPGMCHTTCGEVCVLVYSLIVIGKESTKRWQNNIFPVYHCAWCQSRSESTLAMYSLWSCRIRVLKLAMTSSALGMWFRVAPPLQQKHVLWGWSQIQNWSPVTWKSRPHWRCMLQVLHLAADCGHLHGENGTWKKFVFTGLRLKDNQTITYCWSLHYCKCIFSNL